MADPNQFSRQIGAALVNPPPYGYTADTAPPALAPLYSALAPDPNRRYSTWLPLSWNKNSTTVDQGEQFALPDVIRQPLLGGLDLLSGVKTGQVTPRGAETLMLGSGITGAGLAERGALASGAARPRGQREPLTLYHGTATGRPHESAEGGYFLTPSENLANVYGREGKVLKFSVQMDRPLDLRDKENLQSFISGRQGKESITDYAKRTGYDSVIDPAGSYIALSSDQLIPAEVASGAALSDADRAAMARALQETKEY